MPQTCNGRRTAQQTSGILVADAGIHVHICRAGDPTPPAGARDDTAETTTARASEPAPVGGRRGVSSGHAANAGPDAACLVRRLVRQEENPPPPGFARRRPSRPHCPYLSMPVPKSWVTPARRSKQRLVPGMRLHVEDAPEPRRLASRVVGLSVVIVIVVVAVVVLVVVSWFVSKPLFPSRRRWEASKAGHASPAARPSGGGARRRRVGCLAPCHDSIADGDFSFSSSSSSSPLLSSC